MHLGRNNPWLLHRLEVCQKGPGAGRQQQTGQEPAGCTLGCAAGAQLADPGIPLLSAQQIHSRALHSVWGSSHVSEQLSWFCRRLSRLSESWEQLLCKDRAEGMRRIQRGKDKALEIQPPTTHRKVTQHTEPSSSQQCIVQEQKTPDIA